MVPSILRTIKELNLHACLRLVLLPDFRVPDTARAADRYHLCRFWPLETGPRSECRPPKDAVYNPRPMISSPCRKGAYEQNGECKTSQSTVLLCSSPASKLLRVSQSIAQR
jgi:hypothetical protein